MDQSLLQPRLPTRQGETITWQTMPRVAQTLALASARQNTTEPFIIIAEDNFQVTQIEEQLQFYLADDKQYPIITFPDWEILPYDHFSPHHVLISERLRALTQLPLLGQGILIVSITTLMHRLPPSSFIHGHSLQLEIKQKLDLSAFKTQMIDAGYRSVSQVVEHGEFSIRGSLLDIYPMGHELPFRIDLFDDEIDSIRTFDPDSQLSIETIEKIDLLPGHEYPMDEVSIKRFRRKWREHFSGNAAKCAIYQDISDGLSAPGIEYYLPMFFESMASLFDYFPRAPLIFCMDDVHEAGEKFWQDTLLRYEQRAHDTTRPILNVSEILLPLQDLFEKCNAHSQIRFAKNKGAKYNISHLPEVTIKRKLDAPYQQLLSFINNTSTRVLFSAQTTGRREVLNELLKCANIKPEPIKDWHHFLNSSCKIGITVAPFEKSISVIGPDLTLITEAQLLEQQVVSKRYKSKAPVSSPENMIKDLMELSIGSPIVHIEHGVGRYLGLKNMTVGAQAAEFLTLEYDGGDLLYVPVTALDVISRYSCGSDDTCHLNKLGNEVWEKSKRKAAEKIRDVAAELLELYAKRAAKSGFVFTKDQSDYLRFCDEFPFEETPDQCTAISAVFADMASEKTMDRLVCGDVGFGKTEVALRAAFLAVQNNKQVAVFVPTTLLAQQHYDTFNDRFADWPINVEVISRFKSKKDQDAITNKLQSGKIDIVIGTHSLLRESIVFRDLGLIIIDEEHRFGVRHKERLKTLRAEVDILTLTATPIPRTLNMAFSGLRDISLIATPPMRRLAIKTFVQEYNTTIIREAILRETMRGGQVYYVHNAVKSIDRVTDELRKMLPDLRIRFAHGQMRERELENIMADFHHQRFHVLVSTTIIESGIDIPTANTIIIERADKFGLAQLHQMRGRVGRSHHQAYAYLLTPHQSALTSDAEKRLDALAAHEDLGIGFTLATHDLEIRGAGELLGEEQSGHIHAIGFSLYMELLERAVSALKEGKTLSLDFDKSESTELELQIPALIPETYLDDVHMRLTFYKRLSNAKNNDEIDKIQIEMIDRFGLLPDECKWLIKVTELKLVAAALGIRKIEANPRGGRIEFHSKPNVDPMIIINMVQTRPKQYQLQGADKLRFRFESDSPKARIEIIESVLCALSKKDKS